jgi:serine protease Do
MRIETVLTASTLLLASFVNPVSAQIVIGQGSGDLAFFQVAPTPPAPPTPPTPPPAMGDIIRLMATHGSYLGVGVRDVDAERKKALNLKEERGAEITSVEEDSPAAKAGLKTGDVVLEYASNRVESMEQFIRLVRETPAGREVKIVVSRNGSLITLVAKPDSGRSRIERSMRVATLPPIDVRELIGRADSPRALMYWNSGQLGIEAESLDAQLADFFGVKSGVLVRSVSKNSPAEKAGIKAGDVIVKVEDTKVDSPREVTSALRSARGKDKTVGLTLVREKKEMVLKVTFEDPAPASGPERPRARSVQNKFQ